MKRRSGEALAALQRKAAGPMKHRLAGRGGARNEEQDLMEQALQEHGLQQPFQDSATLVEDCPPGCKHKEEADCILRPTAMDGIDSEPVPEWCQYCLTGKPCECDLCSGCQQTEYYCDCYWCDDCKQKQPCDCFLPWNQPDYFSGEDE